MDIGISIVIIICSILFGCLATLLVLALSSKFKKGSDLLARVKHTRISEEASEEEIKDIVADNKELIDDEKRMIREIIDLGDTTVREVMQPRVDMLLVEEQETVKQAIERMQGTGYSRLPIYKEDYDTIVGTTYYKDLINPLLDGKEDDPVGNYAKEALFVPETKEIYPLLSEDRKSVV